MIPGATVQQIHAGSSGVTSVSVELNGQMEEVTADYYIAAMPVEIMAALVTDELKRLAPSLGGLNQLPTRWMNGIQFYLCRGCSTAAWTHPLRRFALGADVYFAKAILGTSETRKLWRRARGRPAFR